METSFTANKIRDLISNINGVLYLLTMEANVIAKILANSAS